MGDKNQNGVQHLTPGVYVIPTQVQKSGSFWVNALLTLLFVFLSLILIGAIKENFQLRLEKSQMENGNRMLRFQNDMLSDRVSDLKAENKQLKESLSQVAEQIQDASNGLRVWRPNEESTWSEYAKPIGIGAAVALGVGWLTGGLSLGGQMIVGIGGSIATKALGF